MSDLIDRQAAIDAIGIEYGIDASEVLERLMKVDAVEVVRCKYCKYFTVSKELEYYPGLGMCVRWDDLSKLESYCSYAERRTDATDRC